MIKDIYDITSCGTKVTLRIFDMSKGIGKYEDVVLSYKNIDKYEKATISALVPTGKYEMMIECTID